PRENRVITFGADEALRALRQFAAVVENKPLPNDPFEALAIDNFSSVTAEIVRGDGCSGSSRYVFCGERLVQALTYWCSSIGVPLPRRGHKTVQSSNGELQLSITLDRSQEYGALAQLAA
ncbi:MAG: hypothetical protein ACRD2A_12440, partial [Vicinamibacterales bacterium]